MIHFNKETFETALAEGKLMMVDFWAEWCVPCQMLGPVIESLADRYEGRAVIGKINTDEEQALAMSFQITGIPTVIFFKDGKEIDRLEGVMPPDAFIQVLEKNL
jgi:thioredoxin 1